VDWIVARASTSELKRFDAAVSLFARRFAE
jgi:hypothetical protein